MASIAFTDATGAATLTNAHEGTAASRFADWAPLVPLNAAIAHELGTKRRHAFSFGDVYGASFVFRDIPNTQMGVMTRLARHLAHGGEATVNTTDSASRSYTVGIAEGAEAPSIELSDPTFLWYSMAFVVIDLAETPGDMVCEY
jgi:hypothetical protein